MHRRRAPNFPRSSDGGNYRLGYSLFAKSRFPPFALRCSQIVIAQKLEYLNEAQAAKLMQTTDDLGRGLNGLIQTVRKTIKASGFANSE